MKKGMMTLVMFLTLPMFAELSGNFTFSSNYIWRGMTQTMDDPGYSGGFDYHMNQAFMLEHGVPTLLLVVLD